MDSFQEGGETRRAGASSVRRLCGTEDAEPLLCLFEELARAEGWQPGGELRAYVPRSVYFALYVQTDGGEELAGGLQLVRPDAAHSEVVLPCQKVWPEQHVSGDVEREKIAHVAMLALRPAYRGAVGEGDIPLFWDLGVALWRFCTEEGIQTLWLEVTPRTLSCYRRLGWPLVVRGPLRKHWGEDCFLTTLDVEEVGESVKSKAAFSPAYQRILARAHVTTG
jgi:ribosomal protein S18 acetylase RimI-like enzyme